MRGQTALDEKVIGVELNASKKQFKWPVVDTDKTEKAARSGTGDDEDDDESNDEMPALQKTFLLHSAVLGVGAKADQRNLVHLTVKDGTGDKIILDQPILSLSLNKNDSISTFNLRLLLTDTTEVTFKLVEGDGPVHLITSKVLEPPFDLGGYSSDDDDDDQFDMTSDDEMQFGTGDKKKQQSMPKTNKKSGGKKNPIEDSTNNNSSELQQQKKKRKKKNEEDA